jgi:uncharacterized membrane protein
MTKQEFITALKQKLSVLPEQEVRERINFYIEIIDDKIEEGATEQEAVSQIGSVDEIAKQIIFETASVTISNETSEKIKPKTRLSLGVILLLILGFPVWFPLAISLFVVAISLLAVVGSLIVTLWAVFGACAIVCPVGIIMGLFFNHTGNPFTTVAIIGASILCGGLAIFLFFASKKATDGIVLLVKKIVSLIKGLTSKRRAK